LHIILLLLGLPVLFAVLILFAKEHKAYKFIVRLAVGAIIAATVLNVFLHYNDTYMFSMSDYPIVRYIMLGIMLLASLYIVYAGVKARSFLVSMIVVFQIGLFAWFELFSGHVAEIHISIYIDKLTLVMLMIVGLVGGLICLHSEGYMEEYHRRNPELKDRRSRFFAVLLVSISAMVGFVIFNDLTFMLFFLQVITLCAFLLIGYTKSSNSVKNSFTAITFNAVGDLCFAVGIVMLAVSENVLELNRLVLLDRDSSFTMSAILLIVCAGLIKSAQLPFSKWLLGTMEMPMPASAMLHSVTMVTAGAYVIIRLTPMLGNNPVGIATMFVGGVTFLIAAALAGSDARKMLAYSTISASGLIIVGAGLNTPASLWAAIMLLILHAVAKALVFLSFAEHQSCCSDAEQMECLHGMPTRLKVSLGIGMAGMIFAPFVMMISKWPVMQALMDSGNILIIMIITFGSAVTLFFWTKWLGRLIAHAHHVVEEVKLRFDGKVSLFVLAVLVMIVSMLYPLVSGAIVVPFIRESMMVDYYVYISPSEISAIVLMLTMLLIVPVILIPYFKKHWVKETSVYLSGVNTGDDLSYRGAMGQAHPYELQNRNMVALLDERKFLIAGCIICAVIIIGGFFFTMGGAII